VEADQKKPPAAGKSRAEQDWQIAMNFTPGIHLSFALQLAC